MKEAGSTTEVVSAVLKAICVGSRAGELPVFAENSPTPTTAGAIVGEGTVGGSGVGDVKARITSDGRAPVVCDVKSLCPPLSLSDPRP